jgi:hypothetical protein
LAAWVDFAAVRRIPIAYFARRGKMPPTVAKAGREK